MPDTAGGARLVNVRQRWMIPVLAAIAVVVVGLIIRRAMGPYWGTRLFDPSYPYLLNALNIAEGFTPGHTDHPGTTLQELGSAVIYIGWRSGYFHDTTSSLVSSVLHRPEAYLALINDALLALLGVGVAFVTKKVRDVTRQLLLSMLVVALLLTSPAVLECLSQVQPEPLLVMLVMVATVLAIPGEASRGRTPLGRAACLGLVLGASIVTKITCLPVLALLIALPNWRAMAVASIGVGLALVLLTHPIWPVLGDMLTWERNLLTHQGQYGAGAPGLPPMAAMLASAKDLIRYEIILDICLLLMAAAICVRLWRGGDDPSHRCWIRFYAAEFLAVTAQIVIVAKHPADHYLLPAVATSTVLIPLALREAAFRPAPKLIGAATLFLTVAILGPRAFIWETKRIQVAAANDKAATDLTAEAAKINCKIVPYYPAPGLPSSLDSGNVYAGRRYASALQDIYPDFVTYESDTGHFVNYAAYVTPSQVESETRPTCLLGGTLDENISPPQQKLVLLKATAELKLYKIIQKPIGNSAP